LLYLDGFPDKILQAYVLRYLRLRTDLRRKINKFKYIQVYFNFINELILRGFVVVVYLDKL
jgi:hypothetical protein